MRGEKQQRRVTAHREKPRLFAFRAAKGGCGAPGQRRAGWEGALGQHRVPPPRPPAPPAPPAPPGRPAAAPSSATPPVPPPPDRHPPGSRVRPRSRRGGGGAGRGRREEGRPRAAMAWPCISRVCCLARFWSQLDRSDLAVPLTIRNYSDIEEQEDAPAPPPPPPRPPAAAPRPRPGPAHGSPPEPFAAETQYRRDFRAWPLPRRAARPWVSAGSGGHRATAPPPAPTRAARALPGIGRPERRPRADGGPTTSYRYRHRAGGGGGAERGHCGRAPRRGSGRGDAVGAARARGGLSAAVGPGPRGRSPAALSEGCGEKPPRTARRLCASVGSAGSPLRGRGGMLREGKAVVGRAGTAVKPCAVRRRSGSGCIGASVRLRCASPAVCALRSLSCAAGS